MARTTGGIDWTMEVLCTLPRQPVTARLSEVAADLGLDTFETHKALTALMERGFHVLRSKEDGPQAACVAADGWERAQAAAMAYWERTYGE